MENQEFIQEFIDEATVHVENVEAGLLKINENAVDLQIINDIFRGVHSIKGTAGFFGLKNIVELSHSMENILSELRNEKLHVDHEMIDLLLSANDCLKSMIGDIPGNENVDITQYVKELASLFKGREETESKGHEEEKVNHEQPEGNKRNANHIEEQIMDNASKQQHKLYRVRLRLNEDLGGKSITPVQFFKKIESIGNIMGSKTDINDINDLDKCLEGDIFYTFLFTTVLEKKLLSLALEIPEDIIDELNVNTGIEELSRLLNEGRSVKTDTKAIDQTFIEEQSKAVNNKNIQNMVLEDSVRVHVTLLNGLLNLASEMVLGRNQLLRCMEKYRKDIPGIEPILQNIDRITTELQEKIMQTRMQPISNVFGKFPRITRDLARKLGKDIELKLEGTEVELDKSIIEALGDPLTHLVRNAADHGLELPDAREKMGKVKTGTILLKAYHEGGYVNIDVTDDGAGIDIEKIKNKALEKGLTNQESLADMGEQEILQWLFKPGFSTAEKITDVSGRGVGMDVVRTNVEKLGGIVEIHTNLGKGTTFRLLLPLTLAIIPSLIVEVEQQKFALPQANLQEIVRIKPGDSTRKIEFIHNSEVLRLRGKLLPIVHLVDVLGLNTTSTGTVSSEGKTDICRPLHDKRAKNSADPGISASPVFRRESDDNIVRILVLKIGSRRFGIAVDATHGSEEILVKPLPGFIDDCYCYSGVTIMGDGKVAMILDPEGIIARANLKFTETNEDADNESSMENESLQEQQNLLLFKGAGSETFGIDLSLVSRVEEINASEIETIGDREYIKLMGDTLRVIRPEDFLPVSHRNDEKKSKFFVIIPKLVSHPIGILITDILDTVQESIKLNQEDIKAKGITGSTLLKNTLVLLVNLYELFEKADPEHYELVINRKIGEKKTVLVAEDTPFFQRLERGYLEDAGYTVITVQNGKEALQMLEEQKVDIVISDINMPVMDGLELVKRIREDQRISKIPVIAVTSMTGDLQRKTGIEAGFDFYEFKLDRTSLLEKIELAVSRRRNAV